MTSVASLKSCCEPMSKSGKMACLCSSMIASWSVFRSFTLSMTAKSALSGATPAFSAAASSIQAPYQAPSFFCIGSSPGCFAACSSMPRSISSVWSWSSCEGPHAALSAGISTFLMSPPHARW